MKVGMRCYYVVGRPPAKFHRNRSLFDSPTVKLQRQFSRSFRRMFSVSGNRVRLLLSPLLSDQPALHNPPRPMPTPLCSVHRPLASLSEIVPDPARAVVTDGSGTSPNIYKTSPFSYLDFLAILFAIVRLRSEGRYTPKSTHLLYI